MITDELAKERNREAAERTLLAWIRTCLALIGFGFGIDRIVNAVASGREPTGLTAVVGSCFMALGIYGLISASIDYRNQLQLLAGDRYTYRPRLSQTLILAAAAE